MQRWAGARASVRVRVGQAVLFVGLLVGLAPRAGRASETYPEQVQATLSKRLATSYCIPQCILCHRTNLGGYGTLNLFGKNLQITEGLPGRFPNLVPKAIDDYFTNHTDADSDKDGTSDVLEITAGDSPAVANDAGKNLVCPDITYGCGARIAPALGSAGPGSVAVLGLGLAALVARRRRRRAALEPRACG